MANIHLSHLIYPTHKPCTVRFEAEFPMAFREDVTYEVTIFPVSGLRPYGLRNEEKGPTAQDFEFFDHPDLHHPLTLRDGGLEITVTFPQEDCYSFRLFFNGEPVVPHLELYALDEDLLALTPFKGDNHMHTYLSDGKDSPMYMAAAACRFGYDYCVITDHMKYEPSLIARDFFKATNVDFLVIPGEEIHAPQNNVHIINLGGNASVNRWFLENEEEFQQAVAQEEARITEPMVPRHRYQAAASQVIFDKIRAYDGVSVLCHPHWKPTVCFNQKEDITDYLMDHRRFDALELIAGGAYEVGVQLQLSYFKTRESLPILGSSDSHGCFGGGLEPCNYTIVLAEKLETESIKDSIRKGLTIAGNKDLLYGDYRLVKYGYFLLRTYYPRHTSQRKILGAEMLRMASSGTNTDPGMVEKLQKPRPSQLFDTLRYPGDL